MLPKNEVKYIQSLHYKKYRDQYRAFVAEGPKVTGELIQRQPGLIQKIYGTAGWWQALPATMQQAIGNRYTAIEPFELEKISALQTPQQVLAIAAIPTFIYKKTDGWLLALDGIQDPGNLGTIIRTAHWFGIYQVVCSPDCADAFSPKAVQAAMGSSFKVQVLYENLPGFFSDYQLPVYGAVLGGNVLAIHSQYVPGCMIIGNEGRGIRPEVLPFITQKLTIPGAGDAESLNAAVAAGILMQWAFRE